MLCRACGNEMSASEYCPDCNEAVLWKCSSCDKENDKSIHTYHEDRRTSMQEPITAVSVVGTIMGIVCSLYALAPM